MYQHISTAQLADCQPGQLVLLIGRLHRTAARNLLQTSQRRAITLIGEPLHWLPAHRDRLEVWGELITVQPPVLRLHGARPLGSHQAIPPTALPAVGLTRLEVQVSRHGSAFLATTAAGQTYLLPEWADASCGPYLIEGQVSGLSPPCLHVHHANPIRSPNPPQEAS